MSINKRVALIAQLGERQTEDLKVHSSILCQSIPYLFVPLAKHVIVILSEASKWLVWYLVLRSIFLWIDPGHTAVNS